MRPLPGTRTVPVNLIAQSGLPSAMFPTVAILVAATAQLSQSDTNCFIGATMKHKGETNGDKN